MALRRAIYIVGARRTPFGSFGGKLKDKTSIDLSEVAARAAIQDAKVDPSLVDAVVVGNVLQVTSDAPYLARHVQLRLGIPVEKTALTVNRLCGSAFQAIISAAHEILAEESEIVVAGGSENMSISPFVVRGIRFGVPLGNDLKLEDALWATLTDQHIKTPMGVTAETLAEQYNISREECDAFALLGQQRWKIAHDKGYFKDEISPVTIKTKKGDILVDTDEHPRPKVTIEDLAKLPPVFKKNGTVTAGNASGVCDGAGMVVLASEEAVKKHNLTPLARLVAYKVAGVDPKVMGLGPVPVIRDLLKRTGKTLNDIGLVEVNEAFAAQYLAVEKELGLDREITNVNGGAIAIGHPVAASGGRITAQLINEMRRRNVKYSIGSACIGGGQGVGVLLENMQ